MLQRLRTRLEDCRGAAERARNLYDQREEAYGRAFDALVAEQSVLEELYRPLMTRLAAASGTLNKLSFLGGPCGDVKAWADRAEEGLIDLRRGESSEARARCWRRPTKR